MANGDPIRGVDGLCQIGESGAEVEIKYVETYEWKSDVQVTDDGPYVNYNTIDEVAGGTKDELTVTCGVREGGDPGQAAVMAARGLRRRFVFTATGGFVLTFASALIKSAGIKVDAKGKQVFTFTISGACVPTQDS
ncbi:MAG: hypothetical protein HC828_02145 [Blastochloris sp.]|nr:hypothetical protein [Blastochloris sp.]